MYKKTPFDTRGKGGSEYMNSLLKISKYSRVKLRFKAFSPEAHNLTFRKYYLFLKSMFSPSLLEIRGDYYKASDFIWVFP